MSKYAEAGYEIQQGDVVEVFSCGTLIRRYRISRVTAKRAYIRYNEAAEEWTRRIIKGFGPQFGPYDRATSYRIIPKP